MDETPTLLAAFGAGFCSLVSPGVAPLLPAFLGFVHRRGPWQLLTFLSGFSLVFVMLGAGATAAGQTLLENFSALETAAGVLLLAVGLRSLRLRGLAHAASGAGPDVEPATVVTLLVAFLAGAALAFGWTPLAGVVLARILAIASSPDAIGTGVTLLSAYASGRALALLALGLVHAALLRLTRSASRHARVADTFSAACVAASGLLIVVHAFPFIAAALSNFLPLF
jgi:cytochrome c-type biogenesis protein